MWLILSSGDATDLKQSVLPNLPPEIQADYITHPSEWADLGDDLEQAVDREIHALDGIVIITASDPGWITKDALIAYTFELAQSRNIPRYLIVPEAVSDAIPIDHGEHFITVVVGDDLSQLATAFQVTIQSDISPDQKIPDDVSIPIAANAKTDDTASAGQVNDVFISYSRADKPFVTEMHQRLTERGLDVWVDFEDIPQLSDWMAEIYAGIESAHTFVFCMSKHSIGSFICHMEVAHARAHGKRIIPVVIDMPDRNDTYPREVIANLIATPRTQNEINLLEGRRANDLLESNYWQGIKPQNWVIFRDGVFTDTDYKAFLKAYDTDLDHLRTFNALYASARRWKDGGFDGSRLLNGSELRDARAWLQTADQLSKQPSPTDLHREFVRASQYTGRRRTVLIGIVAIIVLGVVAFFLNEANQQTNQRNQAEAQRASLSFVDSAEAANAGGEAFQAISFAMQANLYDDAPSQAKITLANVALQPGVIRVFEQNDLATFLFLDDERMMTNGDNDSLLTWNWQTGEQLELMPVGDEFLGMEDLYLTDDRSRTLHDIRNQLRVVDMATGDVLALLVPPDGTLGGFDVSPDERYVVVSTSFGYAYVWELEGFEMVAELKGHPAGSGGTYTAHFVSDGEQILTTGVDGSYIIWDWRNEEQLERFWIDSLLQTVIIEDSGETMLAGGPSSGLQRIDIETGIVLDEFSAVGTWLDDMVLNNDRSQLAATIRSDFEATTFLQIFDANTTEILHSAPVEYEFVREMEYTPDDRYLVILPIGNTAYLWDFQDPLAESVTTMEAEVTALAVSPSGERVAIALNNNRIQVLDAETGEIRYRLTGGDEPATFLLFAGEDRLVSTIANTSSEKTLTIWDIEDESNAGSITTEIGDSSDIPDMAVSPDGRWLALSGDDFGDTLVIYDIVSSPELFLTQDSTETRGGLNAITFVDDDTLRAIRSSDVADLTLSNGEWSGGVYDQPTLFLEPAGNGMWNDTRTLYAVGTQSFNGGSINYVELSNGEASSKSITNNLAAFAAAPSQSGQAFLGVNASGLIVADTDTAALTRSYEVDAEITAGAFVPGADVAYIAYEGGEIERRFFFADLDELRTWVKENRYFNQPTCTGLVNSNLMTSCSNIPENVRVASIPPTIEPVPSPTFPPSGFDVTDTPEPPEATSVPLGTAVALEADYLNLPFSVIIPDFPGYVADFSEVQIPEDEYDDPLMRSIFAPGERSYSVAYDAVDGSNSTAILLEVSDSPNLNFDDWLTSVGASRLAFTSEQTSVGLPYALSTAALSTNKMAVLIYDGSHYAFLFDSEVDTDDVLGIIEDTFSDPDAFDSLVDAPPEDLDFEIPEVAFQFNMEDDISSLTFVPTIPLSVVDYELFDMQVGSPSDTNVGMIMDTLFSTQGPVLLLGYSDDPADQELALGEDSLMVESGILVMQGRSRFESTMEWYESDPVMGSLANLLETSGNTLMDIAVPNLDTSLYLYADDNRFFLIVGNESTQVLLRFAAQFIQSQ